MTGKIVIKGARHASGIRLALHKLGANFMLSDALEPIEDERPCVLVEFNAEKITEQLIPFATKILTALELCGSITICEE